MSSRASQRECTHLGKLSSFNSPIKLSTGFLPRSQATKCDKTLPVQWSNSDPTKNDPCDDPKVIQDAGEM